MIEMYVNVFRHKSTGEIILMFPPYLMFSSKEEARDFLHELDGFISSFPDPQPDSPPTSVPGVFLEAFKNAE